MMIQASMGPGEFSLTSELIALDDVTYVRFSGLPDGLPFDLPTEWVDLETASAGQGVQLLGAGLSVAQFTGVLDLPLSDRVVTAITPLGDDTIDDQTMQVYQVSVDSAALLDSDFAGIARLEGGGMQPPGGRNGPGLPGGDMPNGTPEPLVPEDVQFTFAVYAGADDGLIHRIYSVISVDSASRAITVTTQTDFSAFNAPVEIRAPDSAG